MQRRRIIDAVAEKADDMATVLQTEDDPVFLDRRDPAEQGGLLQPRGQRLVAECFNFGPGQQPKNRNAELPADMPRHAFVVAAENLDANAVGRERGDRNSRALFWRIKEYDEAGKHEIALIGHRHLGTVRLELAPGNGERPEPVVAERLENLRRPRPGRRIKRQRPGLARFFVSAGDADNVFRRALGDQQTAPVPVLSVHNISMLPRSWIAPSRLTMTCARAMRRAPRASVTETIIGSSSGVSPTARATANRKLESQGRWNSRFTSSTNNTRISVSRTIK